MAHEFETKLKMGPHGPGAKARPQLGRGRRADGEFGPSHVSESPTGALEAQAEQVAHSGNSAASGGGHIAAVGHGRVDPAIRGPVESALGTDLSDVQLHANMSAPVQSNGAAAATRANDIYFAPGHYQPDHPMGRALIRHELAHAAQQKAGEQQGGQLGAHEGQHALPARSGKLQFFFCVGGDEKKKKKKKADPLAKLKAGKKLTASEAEQVIKAYKGMGDAAREKLVSDLHTVGAANTALQTLLSSLASADVKVSYRAEVKDMLQRVQAQATRSAAGGKSDDDLAKIQGTWMEKEAKAKALKKKQEEAKKKGLPIPKTVSKTEIAEVHKENVMKRTIQDAPALTEWGKMVAAGTDKAWLTRAKEVRKLIVAEAKIRVPDMAIKESDITIDPKTIADWGANIFALSGRPMTGGLSFFNSADPKKGGHPKYVIGPVVHEIHGHPMHGSSAESYGYKVFKHMLSKSYFPSHDPAKPGPSKEKKLYGYAETEIFANLIESDYRVDVPKAARKKGITGGVDPVKDLKKRVNIINTYYEPSVSKAILLGMWERFRIDPRLTDKAKKIYKDAVNAEVPGTIP